MSPALLLLVTASVGQTEKSVDPSAAARVRQELVRTLDVRFTRTEVEQAGSRSAALPAGLASVVAKGVPKEETTSESRNRVLLCGRKMRFENNHPTWNMVTGKLEPGPRIAVDNGAVGKLFFSKGIGGDGKPMGRMHNSSDRIELNDPVLNPILFTYRGTDRDICPFPLGGFKRTGAVLPFGDDACDEYTQVRGEVVMTVWLDPAMDYVVRRFTQRKGDHLLHQMDCQYRKDEAWGWVCASWTIHEYGREGNLLRAARMEVTSYRFGGEPAASEFDLTFPPGARLYDMLANKYYTVADDGNMAETNARWEPTGQPPIPQPGRNFAERHKYLLTALTVAVAGALAFLFLRRFSARRSAPSN